MCGSPAEVTDRLRSIEKALSPDRHLSVFDIGGMPQEMVLDTMEMFTGEVIPKMR